MHRRTRRLGLAGAATFAALVGLGGAAHADDGTGTNPDGTRITGGGEAPAPAGFHDNDFPWDSAPDGHPEGNGINPNEGSAAPTGFHENGSPWDDVDGQHNSGAAPAGYHDSGAGTDGTRITGGGAAPADVPIGGG